jgi:hypothetical protein
MLQYFSNDVSISWIGLDLNPGLAAGTYVSFTSDNTTWRFVKDGLGGGIRLSNDNTSGMVAVVIETQSKTHQQLLALHNADKVQKNFIGPFYLNDRTTGQRIVCKSTYIEDEPDEFRGLEAAAVTWVFKYFAKETSPGSLLNPKAAVGT